MTSTFTILCPKGIVMAADSRISYPMYPGILRKRRFKDGITKIYQLMNVGISYWGQAEFQEKERKKTMLEVLDEFRGLKVNTSDDVNSIAKKLKVHLESMDPKIEKSVGLHVAGYVRDVPRLRHIFHESWHNKGEFVNEDCHRERHILKYGHKVVYREPVSYPVLFNGYNLIANALFNYARNIQGYYEIVPSKLELNDCINLAKLIISTAIHRLNYYFDQTMEGNKIPKEVAGPIRIATITQEDGFTLRTYEPKPLDDC